MTPDNHLAHDLDGTGPLLVAVHGITENRGSWDPVDLRRHFRVLRVDLRGHGDSPRIPPYGIDESVADIHGLLESLGEGQTPFVVGHSLGGVIATAYAARHPTRGVVNVDQSLRVDPLPAEVAATVRGEGFADFARTLFASLYGELDPALVADIERRHTLDRDVFTGFWTPLLDWDADALAAWSRRVTTLPPDVPYLSLHGTDPGADYADWLTDRIPTAVVEQAPTRTHYPHLARPDWFVSRVHRFFGLPDHLPAAEADAPR
ncbi:alpha/beta fold hydrolase [Actinokineospora spheciospongiae]|uniref:alpha/beta fold hydrolase n=1 Tax=Actinokineospora spheciospongiae TaxID=909613 RepID=UPI000D70D5EA|nr:alpha/beta hydrolase [Actinokineospora spheciospongiae]PWW60290.1 pimeloyl-ACP methyl ester carboxylesterase [Actinokineospora spheciospongiae]